NCTGSPPTAYLFQGQTQELQPALIEVIEITVGPSSMDQRRRRIDHEPKCIFGQNRSLRSLGRNRLHCCLIFRRLWGLGELTLKHASKKIPFLFTSPLAVELSGLS